MDFPKYWVTGQNSLSYGQNFGILCKIPRGFGKNCWVMMKIPWVMMKIPWVMGKNPWVMTKIGLELWKNFPWIFWKFFDGFFSGQTQVVNGIRVRGGQAFQFGVDIHRRSLDQHKMVLLMSVRPEGEEGNTPTPPSQMIKEILIQVFDRSLT